MSKLNSTEIAKLVQQENITTEIDRVQDKTGEELYFRYLSGDDNAFEEFVKLYEDELARLINSIVSDYYETKHLTVETFAQLALNVKKFEGRSSIKTYLFAIGKNLSTQYIKKRARERHISYEEIMQTFVPDGELPHHYFEREENRRQLHDIMLSLKEEYKTVLIHLYFEDMSYKQAGQAMNKSEEQIKHLAYRAKIALKKKLIEADFNLT